MITRRAVPIIFLLFISIAPIIPVASNPTCSASVSPNKATSGQAVMLHVSLPHTKPFEESKFFIVSITFAGKEERYIVNKCDGNILSFPFIVPYVEKGYAKYYCGTFQGNISVITFPEWIDAPTVSCTGSFDIYIGSAPHVTCTMIPNTLVHPADTGIDMESYFIVVLLLVVSLLITYWMRYHLF